MILVKNIGFAFMEWDLKKKSFLFFLFLSQMKTVTVTWLIFFAG